MKDLTWLQNSGWVYYNHALISTRSPRKTVDAAFLDNKSLWNKKNFTVGCGKKSSPILARWTSDFDCGYETEWWYVIKDDIYDVSKLKAKRRYEITKGVKNFYVQRIDASKYSEELYAVQVNAFSAYPKKYRPSVDKNSFIENLQNNWNSENILVYGAFFRDNNELCGYAYLEKNEDCWDFNVLKTNPNYEKYSVNAAIINQILIDYNKEKESNLNLWINDGSRSIYHETAFQDYLIKYFGFRKAFCLLNVKYNPKFKPIINFLYLFRKIFTKFDAVGKIHQINGIMKMEEIVRRQKNK